MKPDSNRRACARAYGLGATCLCIALVSGCAALQPAAAPTQTSFYSLDDAAGAIRAAPSLLSPVRRSKGAPTLLVNAPRAASGFDGRWIIYVRENHKRERFAHSEWVDAPARMLQPLLVAAIGRAGFFGAVVPVPGYADGDLRLDVEILRLEQEFDTPPSRVRFSIRAILVEDASRKVVATRVFDATVPAQSDDPQGGVVAANRAVQTVLAELAGFCAEAAGTWQAGRAREANTTR